MALFQKDTNPIPSKPTPKTPAPSLLGMGSGEHDIPTKSSDRKNGTEPRDKEPAAQPNASESRLIVGPNIKLKGVEIEDCDTLVVEGYVEASMDSRVIEISETGVYKGTVEIDTAIVKGRFEGELTARDRLIVHETGDVKGTIRYGRLAIDEGGRVHGDLDELDTPPARGTDKENDGSGDKKDGSDTPAAVNGEAAE